MTVYTDRNEHRANQGDVFADVPFTEFTGEGMIAAHDCVCDKFFRIRDDDVRAAWKISVAPVHPLDQLSDDWQHYAREGQMPRYFYLPAEAERPELVADLWLEQPVPFERMLEQGTRITSLSDEWLARLWQQWLRLRLGEDYMSFLRQLVDDAS